MVLKDKASAFNVAKRLDTIKTSNKFKPTLTLKRPLLTYKVDDLPVNLSVVNTTFPSSSPL